MILRDFYLFFSWLLFEACNEIVLTKQNLRLNQYKLIIPKIYKGKIIKNNQNNKNNQDNLDLPNKIINQPYSHQMDNMKNLLNKILDQPQSQPVFKFLPQIKISPKSTLHLQIQPKDPHTASNIVINAYQSKTNRSIVPIKVQWSRYKFKSEEQFTVQKISSVVGNTYMCEPSDLGSVIQAKVKCLDSMLRGEAEATIGPIRIDPMLKRLIDGALYNESLLSQIIIVEGGEKYNVNLRMGKNTMEFTELNSSEKLIMQYSFSQPKIQLSPKDPCKVYIRFEQDTSNTVRGWLNKLTGEQKNSSNMNMNQSSLSIKVPHSNVSAISSKTKLFQRSHIHCVNKLQTRFLSRNSRDLFLFTLRAFICREDMKNSVTMQRIQTLQALKSQEDYNKFLEYISLKSEIIRLAEIAKQLQQDRDSKVKDIANMEQSISEMTLTYLKIIQEKSQLQHVDLEQSYSMISIKREQIMGRKNIRELKSQNQKLKNHIRELNQQIELQKFFKKDANQQSMVFNQTSNPFLKKQNISGIIDQNQSASYYIAGQQVRPNDPTHKNMLEISKSYLKVLEENKKLKERSGSKKGGNDQSMGIENLLESLHESEEDEKRMVEMQGKVQSLKDEIERLNQINKNLLTQNSSLKQKLTQTPPPNPLLHTSTNSPLNQHNQSYISHQNTSMISNSYMSMNQSMTSQAELGLLQKKLIDLANINAKFQSENARLRRERDYFRALYDGEVARNKLALASTQKTNNYQELSTTKHKQNLQDSNLLQNGSDHDNSVIIRLKQDKQKLQNQKNSLLKKIDSLTRQSNIPTYKTDPNIQKRYHQLSKQNQHFIQQNQSLKKTIENIKSFHQLQKKELQGMKLSGSSSTGNNDLANKNEQIERLKKVNGSLLTELKELRIELEKRNDNNLDSSRVIELQNQLNIFKTYANGSIANNNNNNISPSFSTLQQNQKLIQQLTLTKKQNHRLKEQISTLQLKITTQTTTIQKLMTEIDQLHHQNLNTSNSSSTFNKKYLTPDSSPNKSSQSHEVQKYKKKLSQLQAELQILKRNSDAVNRSRDLSMSMMGYQQQRLELYKKQNQSLMMEVENLNKMCSKYSRDAREANMEVSKLREKIMMINKERLDLNQ